MMSVNKIHYIVVTFAIIITIIFINSYGLTRNNSISWPQIDKILIEKSKRTMTVYSQNNAIKTYRIALGFAPIGHKQQEGDGKTPEGHYTIAAKNPRSQFHLSLKISYPSATNRLEAHRRGINPGSDIMIHGLGRGFGWLGSAHYLKDWTLGCIAVTNEEIDELYPVVKVGTAVEIVP